LPWKKGEQVRSTPALARPPGSVPRGGRQMPGSEIVVTSAHGGAGATTLAALLRTTWDMGVVRRVAGGGPRVSTGGRPLVLVTRNTTAAAASAIGAVNVIAEGGGRVDVLAIVGDGLPEPQAAAYRFQVLAARVGAVVRVPFVASLRAADDPAQAALPRKAGRAIAGIRTAAFAPTRLPETATTVWE
jgi:hypothetical protein